MSISRKFTLVRRHDSAIVFGAPEDLPFTALDNFEYRGVYNWFKKQPELIKIDEIDPIKIVQTDPIKIDEIDQIEPADYPWEDGWVEGDESDELEF